MIVKNGGDKSAPEKTTKKRATKKKQPAADPISTCISSPVRGNARKINKGKSVAAAYLDVEAAAEDDEVDNEDFDPRVARYANGYAQDGFVVDDDDEDDYFDAPVPPPPKRRRQRTLDELGSHASSVALPQPDEIQALILDDFMREAMKLEEELRNSRNLMRPLFTEVQIQQMLVRWTDSAAKMCRIPGIDEEKVRRYGVKLVPIVVKYHDLYLEMFQGQEDESMAIIPATAGPSTSRRAPQQQQASEVVDLLSDDDDDDDDNDNEDEYNDEEPGEASKYFGAGPRDDPVQKQLEGWQERFAATGAGLNEPVSRGRNTNTKKSGKRNYYKKGGGGGSRGGGKSFSGVSKRKGSAGGASGSNRRTSGASARSGASRSSASTARKAGGGAGGIGIMPF